MVDNTIAGNQAQDSLAGFYAELYNGSRLVMVHNLIRANTAITGNAGIYLKGGMTASISWSATGCSATPPVSAAGAWSSTARI